ncbi:MAG: hypothetical protein IRZ08_13105 [Frankia sp.]|nr:hypothetical protein [Frankia sp.]
MPLGLVPADDSDPLSSRALSSNDGRRAPQPLSPDVIWAAWHACAEFRHALHRRARAARCDTVLRLGPATMDLTGTCVCRDFFADLLADVAAFVAGAGALRMPGAAVFRHVRRQGIGNWIRRTRFELGAQVRTDRIREAWHGRRLPDDYHRAVLEYLADEAGSLAPLDSDEQLLARLARLAAAEFGGEPEEHRDRVAAAMATVEGVCRTGRRKDVNGELVTWWDAYIEIPLGRRPRATDLPIAAQPPGDGRDRPAGAVTLEVAADWTLEEAVAERAFGPGGAGGAVVAALGRLPEHLLADPDGAREWVLERVVDLADEGLLPAPAALRLLADPALARAATAAVIDYCRASQPSPPAVVTLRPRGGR